MKLNDLTLSPTEIAAIQQALPTLSIKEKMELFDMLEEREKRYGVAAARQDMISFAKRVYPGFKVGPHHRKLAKIFTDVIEGRKNRVIINIAPRMGKSEFSSYLFPAFFLGNYPNKKIIMGTHTASLSEDFGRKVRNLIASEDYRELFPRTVVADDQKAAGKWGTGAGGQYYAAGYKKNVDLEMLDPTLMTRRQLNVLIEEVFHAHLYDLSEKKARKFSANLGKLIYNRFLKK